MIRMGTGAQGPAPPPPREPPQDQGQGKGQERVEERTTVHGRSFHSSSGEHGKENPPKSRQQEPQAPTDGTRREDHDQGERLKMQGETWGDKVRANLTHQQPITDEAARKSHMLEGIWNPVQQKQLIATITTDWSVVATEVWTEEEEVMRKEALTPASASCDESLRTWTAREQEILMMYLAGNLDLPYPPNFVKEIMTGEHRAMLEDMHEAYFNANLTAALPASVRINKHAPHAVLFKELFMANTDRRSGHMMMNVLQRDAKRLSFDGVKTLRFTFYSKKAATRWKDKTMRFQKAVITIRDTERSPEDEGTGHYNPAQLELQYAIRVYGGAELELVTLARAFTSFSEANVLDVEYARATQTDIYDDRYHTIRFAQRQCPEALKGVSKIELNGVDITIHHFQ